jgi:hypothetical protein
MPLPCPGPQPISLANIQSEFGGSNPIGLGEYYRNGAYVGSNNTNVPTSGPIKLSDFFCAVNEIVRYITATSTNVNASSYFTAGEWSSSAPKRLVINSGVTVGATDTSNYALNIPSGFGGTFKLDNNGSIQGAGGFGSGNSNGGNAIFAGSAVSINNLGTIYAGGGSGGTGGDGGQGYYTYNSNNSFGYQWEWVYGGQGPMGTAVCQSQYVSQGIYNGNPDYAACCVFCVNEGGATQVPDSSGEGAGTTYVWCDECFYYVTNTAYTSGGLGGQGGIGQGYNQNPVNGFPGSNGGTNAGNGGTGGNGGTWGSSGGIGNVGSNGNYTNAPTLGQSGGPTYGGLAGYYIVNNSNVTWVATGTRLGRVG